MDYTAMLNILVSVYNSAFMILFIIMSVIIVLVVVQKLIDFILAREEDRSGSYGFITGCDCGFGYATTYELNSRGIHVFAACLTHDAVEKFNNDDNFKGTAFVMNVTKNEDILKAKTMVEDIVKEKGLFCLFNNAGVFEPGPIEWMSEHDMRTSTEINLWGAVNVTKAMLPLIKKARGRIINTCSIAGRVCFHYLCSYHISKYAFEAFSDCLRYEMKPWGVSVHIIEPGVMPTDLYTRLEKRWKSLWEKQTKDMQDAYGEDFVKMNLDKSDEMLSLMTGNPKQVVKAYLHAALSSRPKLRYLVGLDANFLALTVGLIPTYIADVFTEVLFRPVLPAGKIA